MPSCFRILCYHVNIEFCKQEEEYIFFAGVGVGTDNAENTFQEEYESISWDCEGKREWREDAENKNISW